MISHKFIIIIQKYTFVYIYIYKYMYIYVYIYMYCKNGHDALVGLTRVKGTSVD